MEVCDGSEEALKQREGGEGGCVCMHTQCIKQGISYGLLLPINV